LEAATDRLLDRALEAGRLEAITELATPIPVAMIADLMGIPAEDHPRLLEWSHAIVKVFDQRVTAEEGHAAEAATRAFVDYLQGALEQRRAHPGDDLISAMIQVEEEGDVLTDDEIVGTAILTLNAGHEATVHAIGNGLLALASRPADYDALHRGEPPIATAVEELLRFDSPLQMFERWVLDDTELEGHPLAAGSKVGLLFGSANHDDLAFGPDAGRVDLTRSPNPHVSFGAGLHFCVGAPLATVELEATFSRLASRVRAIELVEVGERIESLVFRGVNRLTLELDAA
jgi:cytochrome P450